MMGLPIRLFQLLSVLSISFVIANGDLYAQEAPEPYDVYRPADTSSPKATLKSFIEGCNELNRRIRAVGYYDRNNSEHLPLSEQVLDCLDLSKLPAFAKNERAGEVATCLKEILDRVDLPPYDEIPGIEEVNAAGGTDKLTRWQIPGTRLSIAPIKEGPRRHEYLFTLGTVDRAVEYYQTMRKVPYRTTAPEVSKGFHNWYVTAPNRKSVAEFVHYLPVTFRERLWGVAKWKWVGLVFALLILSGAYFLTFWLHGRATRKFLNTNRQLYFLTIIFPVLAILIPQYFKYYADEILSIRGNLFYYTSFLADTISFMTAIFLAFSLSNRIAVTVIASPQIHPQGLDAQLIRIVCRLTSLIGAVVIFLIGGQHLGIPFTTLLASAGVGGLAVALSAQDTLKTLFGTIMLMADKPFRVGERIIFKNYDGIVEDIGLRSTRLRLLTGHQATIPNDELARSDIENVGRRPHIRRVGNIQIPIDTKKEKVEKAVKIVTEALQDHEGMDAEKPPRVYFSEFIPGAFNLRFMYWYSPAEYWDFMDFSEKLNFRIFQEFEENEIQFSLPKRVSYWAKDGKQTPFEIKTVNEEISDKP